MFLIQDLRTEYKINPIGMDEPHPRFSYRIDGKSAMQSARRIRVYSGSPDNGTPVWDSGVVSSGETLQIEYEGAELRPFTRYYWSVTVTFSDGTDTDSDGTAYFETGFLNTPWQSKWISGKVGIGPYRTASRLARTFAVRQGLQSARLYSTALGLYEAFVNGTQPTEDVLMPGWSQYFDHVQYQAYDVTSLLHEGENALAARLGDGWFCGVISYVGSPDSQGYGVYPMFRAELRLTYEDGTIETIPTDNTWASFTLYSALLNNDMYLGEQYDAMADDTEWKFGRCLENHPCRGQAQEEIYDTRIVWNSGAPVRRKFAMRPVTIQRKESGTYLLDFGQNLTGREHFRIRGSYPGTTITIKHGEMLNSDGSLYRDNLLYAQQMTVYTCGSAPNAEYEPSFVFYGFRYMEISGWPEELTQDDIRAEVLYSDLPETASFECSNPLLNKLWSNILWSQRGNFVDVPTDCPQRCERFGWTGDAQVFINMATYNMYAPEFFSKWIDDLNASRHKTTGAYPLLAPDPSQRNRLDSARLCAGWGDAGYVCPWIMYVKYGDTRLIQRYYDNMKLNMDMRVDHVSGEILFNNGIGDHLALNAVMDRWFLASAYCLEMLRLFIRMARAIGKESEANEYNELRNRSLALFRKKFFTDDGTPTEKVQTACAMALVFDLCPDENSRRKTAEILVHDIRVNREMHLSTGFLGTPILLKALVLAGETKLAYSLLEQTSYPSWLYPVTQGATTIWERWNSWSNQDGFHEPGMNSFNHYAYGAVGDWMIESICGICPDGMTAFRHFTLAPHPGNSLSHAAAHYDSCRGTIRSAWRRENNTIVWNFTVPGNTTATVVFPTSLPVPALKETRGIQITSDGEIIASAGDYEFRFEQA